MGIIESLFSRKGRKAGKSKAVASAPRDATKLMMLMPDASGLATYQLHTFTAASQAEGYLKSILRGEIQEGTIMFWGLTWLPSENGNPDVKAEPVVLIRDPNRPGLVYTFSFVDLDSAYDFVRHEMKVGADLAQAAIFWAVPAEATANPRGEITVTPSRPPVRQPAPSGAAPFAAPAPNGTQLHVAGLPPISVPELVSDEPDTPVGQEAAAEPADGAIEATDISTIVDILRARGLSASSSPLQPIDKPAPPERAFVAADATMNVDLSDVFRGRRDPETLTTLEDFRRLEAPEASGADAAHEGLIEAEAEPVSGIIAAWSNISAAIDTAIDAHVTRRVSEIITWRRLSRAFAVAADVRMFVTWRTISRALSAAASIQSAHERALAEVWRNAARACHQAAESKSGRRAMRLAWANISWTLEEAVYAARLQQKKTTEPASENTRATSARGSTNVKTKTKKAARKARASRTARAAPEAIEEAAVEQVVGLTAGEQAEAIENSGFRPSGRFDTKKDPFTGFDSPPGRF